jgi:DNA-binding CsgD family transcriptional regulator/tetratricopeptide (TPR) repeat protein
MSPGVDLRDQPQPPLPEPPGELLERERELVALHAAIDAARRGDGAVVLIEGPAGVGKTRLVHAAAAAAHETGMLTLTAVAHELDRDVPGSVAKQLVAPLVRNASPSRRRQLTQDLEPRVAALLNGARPALTASGEDPAAALIVGLAEVIARVLAAGDHRTAVIVLDDAHWADAISLRLLSYLALAPERRVAVIAATRLDEPGHEALHDLRAAPAATLLRPAPLSATAVTHLVRMQMPSAEPDFCDLCARATAGNPFLVGEMLRALAEEGIPGTSADAARLSAFVPDSVLRSVLVRLARLSPQAVALARAAAVLETAPLRVLAQVAGLSSLDAERAADALVGAGFLDAREPLGFTHPLVRRAVYQDQSPFACSRLHRRAAEVLDAGGSPVQAIAAHLRLCRADGDQWVVDRLRAAASYALESGDAQSAVELLERALTEPPVAEDRPTILIELADARAGAGVGGVMESLHEALDLIDEPDRRAQALYDLGIVLLARFDLKGAADCAQRGLDEIASPGPLAEALEGILLASAVLVPELQDRVQTRIAELREAVRAGRDPTDPVTLSVLALHMTHRGEGPEVSKRLVGKALTGFTVNTTARAAMMNQVGSTLLFVEDLSGADRELTDVIEAATREGRALTAAFARVWRAHVHLRSGRLADAVHDARQALELRHFGWTFHVGPCLAALIEALLEQGDEAGARAEVEIAEQTTHVVRQPLLLRARARFMLATGDPSAAAADIETARRFLVDTHDLDHPSILPWRSERARALAQLDRQAEAVELALAEAQLARRTGNPRGEGIALATAGTIARGREGIEWLEHSVELLASTPAVLEHARALVELGATLRRTRERTASREPLRRALQQAVQLGAGPLAQRARDELRATGAHPRREALDGVGALTPTEHRIAELAAQGMSNRAIAATLVVTAKTVEWHLSRIYGKLGVSGRAGLAPALLGPAVEQGGASQREGT